VRRLGGDLALLETAFDAAPDASQRLKLRKCLTLRPRSQDATVFYFRALGRFAIQPLAHRLPRPAVFVPVVEFKQDLAQISSMPKEESF